MAIWMSLLFWCSHIFHDKDISGFIFITKSIQKVPPPSH